MFKIIDFYNAPYEEETTTYKFKGDEWKNSKLFGEEFLIRRIDGIQMLKLTSFNEKDLERQVPYVLGLGILDSDSRKPIGNEVAVEFVKRYYRESTQLFSSIMTFAQGVTDMEEEIFEDERKNSNGTDSQSLNTSSANGSDSTQE